jgi:carbamoyl-phosphate synthase large subunit
MKSVGEVMAIGRTFPEAMLKGWRALETGGDVLPEPAAAHEVEALQHTLREPSPERLRDLFRLLAADQRPEELAEVTGIDPWFLHQMRRITDFDRSLRGSAWDEDTLRAAKRLGFSDRHRRRWGLPDGGGAASPRSGR